METRNNTDSLSDIYLKTLELNKVEEVAPNFREKNKISDEDIEKIVGSISYSLNITKDQAMIGMMLLFLQGAASAGAPPTMHVDLMGGKCIEKRNIINACNSIVGHSFIRRIAESMAVKIGNFALKHGLKGELANRISNRCNKEGGGSLNDKEIAYCSSFSQAIPNLGTLVSERLVKLLAEDYSYRFEGKRKTSVKNDNTVPQKINKKIKKPKKKK
jgi:hypothetical protein